MFVNPDTDIDTNLTPKPDPKPMATPTRHQSPVFSGENYVSADVHSWIFTIKAYVRAVTDEEERIEIAASFLSSTADKWFIGAHLSSPFITFDAFIEAFKTRFTQGG